MGQSRESSSWKWLIVILGIGGTGAAAYGLLRQAPVKAAATDPRPERDDQPPTNPPLAVHVVHPRAGDMDRISKQPGSVHAFESVQLYAGVSGFLKSQSVDIGDRIKTGKVLAKVDVPELEKQVERNASIVVRSNARVALMKARATSARAEWDAAKAAVPRSEAMLKAKSAELRYQQQRLQRIRELAASHSIEDKVVDEYTSNRDAVREGEIAAQEGVTSAKATVAAMAAKILAADADVDEAKAEVKVAQADLEKSQVLVQFSTVTAPFDGVVTQRNFFPSDFVRAANEGAHMPLLTVQRTDLMRVVVQVPDRDVPYCDVGDQAIVEIDALPGEKLPPAKVSRVAHSEDAGTRLMHVEIDVPNPTGKIRNGMYGRVTIILEKSNLLSVPSSCLVGKFEEGRAWVYVVRGDKIVRTPVRYSEDNGVKVGILSGLKPEELIVRQPPSGIGDEAPAVIASVDGKAVPADGGTRE